MPRLPTPPAELVSFLEGLPDPHILLDDRYRILAANGAYRRQFGASGGTEGGAAGSVVGRTCPSSPCTWRRTRSMASSEIGRAHV